MKANRLRGVAMLINRRLFAGWNRLILHVVIIVQAQSLGRGVLVMTESEQKDFLMKTMVSLLERTLVYQSLEEWLILVGVDSLELKKVLQSFRDEMAKDGELPNKLRSVVESSLQSGEADYDFLLASSLALWKSDGMAN
jgi:hypothetical protein